MKTTTRSKAAWFVNKKEGAEEDWTPLWRRDSEALEEHYQSGDRCAGAGDVSYPECDVARTLTDTLMTTMLMQMCLCSTAGPSPTLRRALSRRRTTCGPKSRR